MRIVMIERIGGKVLEVRDVSQLVVFGSVADSPLMVALEGFDGCVQAACPEHSDFKRLLRDAGVDRHQLTVDQLGGRRDR